MTDEAPVTGRPTEYQPEYAAQAEKLCLLGATDSEIADFFGVSVRTIHRWKIEHEEFCHSIKSGKEKADERVERSLYQKATGYDYTEEQAIKIKVEQHTLWTRRQFVLHPYGIKWTDATVAGEFPTNTELATADNWDRVYPERKQIAIAALVTNL